MILSLKYKSFIIHKIFIFQKNLLISFKCFNFINKFLFNFIIKLLKYISIYNYFII